MEPPGSEKSCGVPRGSGGTGIASQTPQKLNEPPVIEQSLPERYKIIAELFDRMTCSLRLLNLCKKPPTFQNVSAQVRVLTKREFSYRHLAQIKFLLPGAVQIDKILIHDQKTLCMRPDVKITLLFDCIDVDPEQSKVVVLQEIFASKLEDFASSHPEACDVPEAMLPELLDQSHCVFSQTDNTPQNVSGAVAESHPSDVGDLLEAPGTSHFRKHFSEKVIVPDAEKTSLLASQRHPIMPNQDIEINHNGGLTSSKGSNVAEDQTINSELDGFPEITPTTNSIQFTSVAPVGFVACESPAVKDLASAECLLIDTPAQVTPKRAIPDVDDCVKSTYDEKCLSSHKPAKRVLNFSLEGDGSASVCAVGALESDEHVPYGSICAALSAAESSKSTREAVPHKEGCNDPKNLGLSHQRSGMCRQITTGLPGTVTVINKIFRGVGFSSITKEELLHKIIMNNYDIVERREAEEHVELLEKLFPDWIGKDFTSCGDFTYSIKRESSIESILSRISTI